MTALAALCLTLGIVGAIGGTWLVPVGDDAEMMEEMEQMKKDFKGAFEHLADIFETSIGNMKNDTNDKCKLLADTLMKLNDKISKGEKAAESSSELCAEWFEEGECETCCDFHCGVGRLYGECA